MHKQVKNLIKQLLDQLAPHNMERKELKRLGNAAGLGESTIRNARYRDGLSLDTFLALLLAHGVDPHDILNLPRKKTSKISPTHTKWYRLGLELSEKERIIYMDMILSIKDRLRAK